MTPDELRANLIVLGLTQRQLAALLGRGRRTVEHWVAGSRGIPPEAAILIRLLASGKLTIADIEAARGKPLG